MGKFDGCLLACDIDGTLTANGVIPDDNVKAIEHFAKEGGLFSIATGRSIVAFYDVLEKIPDVSLCVVFNGAVIYDYKEDRIVYEETLPDADKYIIKEVLSLGKNIGIEIHSGKKVYTVFETKETIDHHTHENLERNLASFDDVSDEVWNKVLFTVDNEDELKFLVDSVSKFNLQSSLVETSTYIDGKKRLYYEIIPFGIDKGKGLEKLKEILKVKKGCTFAIGDYYNDLEMIKKADIGAAVEASPDDIKQFADYVAVECEKGAVADFINFLEKRKDAENGQSN